MALQTAAPGAERQDSPLRYQRIVVKAGTNVLTRLSSNLDRSVMASITNQLADVVALGAQAVLVTSGAIAAGREAAPQIASGKGIAASQMLAAIGQSRLMNAYQELLGERGLIAAQALLTARDMDERARYLNIRNTLRGLLDRGIVPIVNENDVVDTAEIDGAHFGDNDTLSAIVANVVDADLLLILTDTGGLYTADPKSDPSAALIPEVTHIDESVMALAGEHHGAGRGGMASKLEAARYATALGITVVFGPGKAPDAVMRAARGEPIGTTFPPSAPRVESRKRWLLSGMTKNGGALVIDDGAQRALVDGERSLLPAGVRTVRGRFVRGDVVEVVAESGKRLAYGLANYDSSELRKIAGVRSNRIGDLLGHHHGDEAIHRNNLVMV